MKTKANKQKILKTVNFQLFVLNWDFLVYSALKFLKQQYLILD